MPDNRNANRQSRQSSGRRRRRRRNVRSFQTPKDFAACPVCEQNIRDILTAIVFEESGVAAHFDCVLKKLSDEEDLMPKEKICYLGGGEFGVVRFNSSNARDFTIKKRIKFENKENEPEWRRRISQELV